MCSRCLQWMVALGFLLPSVAFAADDELRKSLTLRPEQYADDASANRTADELEKAYPAEARPEAVRMMLDILRNADIGPRSGWFGPAQSRFDWKWMAEQHGLDPAATELAVDKFRGSPANAKRLDRDGDGSITPDDLDWSDRNPWVQQAYLVSRIFRRINAKGDGRLTRNELNAFFDRVSQGKDHLLVGDLREALLGGGGAGDEPSRETLVRGLMAGEVGSIQEGPQVGQPAPEFTLQSPDGKMTHQLSKLIGAKPVVLCFGNFTCGPFRSFYPEVDALFERYRGEANFLMVYVREAHPTDGWAMEANTRAGVAAAQPKTLGERAAVCDQFCQRLKPTLPVVVDDVTDDVGNAYSGMPARLYLIDSAGKIAYKSGRGPFGFKVGELEQALAMALVEAIAK
jgi:iodothyronine deiodinase-like protein